MRGEETQIVGAVAGDASPTLAVLPGTHSKWAIARDGAIASFATYMTGEVYAVLREHSILGRMAGPNPQALDPQPAAGAAFARGVRAALADGGAADSLLHRLFGARTLALRADLAPAETSDYLSGLLIGSEVAAGREWARRRGLEAAPRSSSAVLRCALATQRRCMKAAWLRSAVPTTRRRAACGGSPARPVSSARSPGLRVPRSGYTGGREWSRILVVTRCPYESRGCPRSSRSASR